MSHYNVDLELVKRASIGDSRLASKVKRGC
jgi:hypothetical protein